MPPDNEEHNFSVWLFRERGWRNGDKGRLFSRDFREPVEAVETAERALKFQGVPGQSYAEIRFNGDKMPHTVICLLQLHPWERFGVWNTEAARWPVYYPPDNSTGGMIPAFPFEDAEDGNFWSKTAEEWQAEEEAETKQKSEQGNMKLDEIKDDGKEEHDGDEGAEDEEVQEDDEAPDDDGDDEDAPGDEDEGDEEEREEDDGDDEEIEDEDDDAGPDGSGDEIEEGGEEEDDRGEDRGEEEGEEDEMKLPRLNIFAKMRGPLGWRKRAEAEELQERNTFAMKIGVLDTEAEKPAQQEREVFAEIQFIESDDDREAGLLRMKLPKGVEFSEPTKAGWITARVPYRKDDDND